MTLLSAVAASAVAYHLNREAILRRTTDGVVAEFQGTLGRLVPNYPSGAPETYRFGPENATDLSRMIRDELRKPGRAAVAIERPPGRVPPEEVAWLGVPVPADFLREADTYLVHRRIEHRGTPYLLVGARAWDLSGRGPILAIVAQDLRPEARTLESLASSILAVDGVVLALALALALLTARGVLVPVRRLAKAADALGEGALDTRVEVRGADELASLATTFNRTAERLESNIGELRAMEEASRRFVADVSHELRTPLTAMTALTDVLRREDTSEPDLRRAGLIVADGVGRLRTLVDHLIEISRYDANTATLVLDDVILAEALRATLSVRAWEDDVLLEVPEDLMARLDPRRFDVIVANLVGNALRHGAPPIVVRVRPEARGGRPGFTLTVLDHGPGIPDDLLPLVFDRFVKRDPARAETEGSGLGLSLTRAYAELHGGDVTARNAPPAGAMFTLWLPVEGAA
ncbi:sensor histidine kinase [Bailinhaonella thermotolerans]|uniref:sensor histidine kinase n=1 Tax=Bailinhaonella thermotolerans TaxID=1070861 RepID=UPI00192A511F|nr:HAMP domain-containing sensor histidine kinase [Bailinhaonella thermotolerans]